MNLKSTINEIINNTDDSIYFIHRTAIGLPWIDIKTGKIYSQKEYEKLYKSLDLYSFEMFRDEWYEHKLDEGAGWTVTEEQYQREIVRNFKEQINKFFQKGLYAVETSIERTANSIEDGKNYEILSKEEQRKKLEEIITNVGFGMNTIKKNTLLGALSNREELNILLILEIPKKCFGNLEEIKPLFQKSDEPLKICTAYRGFQTIENIIPSEYIKGAFYVSDNGTFFEKNERYKSGYIYENGIYDRKSIDEILRSLENLENLESSELEKLLNVVNGDFELDKEVGEFKSRISFIKEKLLGKVSDSVERKNLQEIIERILDKFRNPFEKICIKIENSDFSTMEPSDIMANIEELLQQGSDILEDAIQQESLGVFNNMFKIYYNCLRKIDSEALKQIYFTNMANDAIALIEGKLADMVAFAKIYEEYYPLYIDILVSESLGELREGDYKRYKELKEELKSAGLRVCDNPLKKGTKNNRITEGVRGSLRNIAYETRAGDIRDVSTEIANNCELESNVQDSSDKNINK